MEYSLYLFYGLAGDLNSSHGSGELDELDDRLLHDIGFSRVDGHVVKNEDLLDPPVMPRKGWPTLGWHSFVARIFLPHGPLTR